jgi:penicillin-binding protein-related factor A (putative recombinase)
MNDFEKQIGETFQAYRDAKVAHLFFLHPPMRIAGMHGHVPCYVQAGKAPYDVAGFYYDRCGTALGVELKETKDRETSIAIVGEGKKGSGLQYHQLQGLVDTYEAGGRAMLLWSNGGEIGRLDGDALVLVKLQYDTSVKAEKANKSVAKGSRSIPWGLFSLVKHGHKEMPLWIPPKLPCNRGATA